VALTALSSGANLTCTFSFAPGAIDLATDVTNPNGPGNFTPGVWCITGAASIGTAGINLSGSGTYIFRMTGALTTDANSAVRTAGGASACDVFWTPGGATTLGANSTFLGTDIDASGITIGSTVAWQGRALAFGGTVSTDTDTIAVPPCAAPPNPAMTVAKSSTTSSLSAPGTVSYSYLVTNSGDVTLTGISLSDNNDNNDVSCPSATLASGANMTCSATHTFTQAELNAGGTLDNTVTASSNETREVTANLSIPIRQSSALTLEKTIFSGSPFSSAGGTISYHFLVTNTGNVSLANPVTVTDDQSADESCPNTNTVGNHDGFLDPGESLTCTASHAVTQADLNAGSLTNHATAHAGQVNSNEDQATAQAAQSSGLTLAKTIFSGSPYGTVGGIITYHFLVTNTGNVSLANPVTITDDQSTDESCPNTNTVGNHDGFLDPGESLTCTASHTVTQADLNAGSLTNHATAHAGRTASNQAQATATVNGLADLSIIKTADTSNISVGAQVTFTIRIQHTGSSRADATAVVVTDVLPQGLELVSGPVCNLGSQTADAQCTYDSSTRTITARWSKFTLAGGAGQISLSVRGNRGLDCMHQMTNVAVVRWNRDSAESDLSLYPRCATHLPVTGFLPGVDLSSRPGLSYDSGYGMSMDISRLGLGGMNIVGVPLVNGTWDVFSLGADAGWLESTAAPGQDGNSVISAHVTDIYGWDGPFAQLGALEAGDAIYIHASGEVYTYVVQTMRNVAPDDLSVLEDAGVPMLTLVTCSDPNYVTHTYDARLVVQAVMVQQSPEQ
jgi:LPXTG-site transpeptidase (sortase) family protein